VGVLLNGTDIEIVNDVREIHRPKLNNYGLGILDLQITQNLKAMLHQYQIAGVWTQGDPDYDNRIKYVKNLVTAGLPVWFDATFWRKNALLFGKVHDLEIHDTDGKVNASEFKFMVSGVMPWGYTFVQSDGAGDFRIYDQSRIVQSRALYSLLRDCSYTKTGNSVTFSFYIKNVGASSGIVILEMMVPDEINSGNVTSKVAVTAGWSLSAGTVGTTGFSSVPGTKQRVTLTQSIAAGSEILVTVTITVSSPSTSFIDGSFDDIAAG
jgi:hypothetical protein